MTKSICYSTEGPIAQIVIDRAEKKNALTTGMYAALTGALCAAEQNADVNVIIIRGTADCFTAGNDLHDFLHDPPSGEASPVFQFLNELSSAKKPLVAAVTGPAIGIGTTMLLHCDLVLAGEHAIFQLPFVKLGLCPEAASSFLLPQLLGHQRAAELLLLGESFSAQRAWELGLVNRVLPDGDVFESAREIAAVLAAQPPGAVRVTKQLLKQSGSRVVAETLRDECRHFLERLDSRESQDALAAFFK